MSTTSFVESILSHLPTANTVNSAPRQGFGTRMMAALMHAREQQAEREVSRFLSRQSDRFLRDIGLDDAEIAKLRRHENV